MTQRKSKYSDCASEELYIWFIFLKRSWRSILSIITHCRAEDAFVTLSVRNEGQVRACRWPRLQVSHKNDTRHLSCVPLHIEQACFYWLFPLLDQRTQPHARTSARCIMGTIYQSHHALQALNTATVFLCVSLPSFSPLSLDCSFTGAAVSF